MSHLPIGKGGKGEDLSEKADTKLIFQPQQLIFELISIRSAISTQEYQYK
jgi:hypothetical protein